MLNCDLSHHRSVAVLCMLYKIRCNPKHPLCGALPVPYVPVQVTRSALIIHRYTFAPLHCKTFQVSISVSLIGCQSPSPGLALPIFLNNNNNNNNNNEGHIGKYTAFCLRSQFIGVVQKNEN